MSKNSFQSPADASDLWTVISDPYTYADWVVGAKEIRGVSGSWPAVGSVLHHTVGVPVANIKDNTESLEEESGRHIKLRGRVRPLGVADIQIDLEPNDSGTLIVMSETIVGGPAKAFYGRVMDVAMRGRNAETLRRLSRLAVESANKPAT